MSLPETRSAWEWSDRVRSASPAGGFSHAPHAVLVISLDGAPVWNTDGEGRRVGVTPVSSAESGD